MIMALPSRHDVLRTNETEENENENDAMLEPQQPEPPSMLSQQETDGNIILPESDLNTAVPESVVIIVNNDGCRADLLTTTSDTTRCCANSPDDTLLILNSGAAAVTIVDLQPPLVAPETAAEIQNRTSMDDDDGHRREEPAPAAQVVTASDKQPATSNNNCQGSQKTCDKRQSRRRYGATARSFFCRIRNRLKPVAPCQSLHLVPSSSKLEAKESTKQEAEEQQQRDPEKQMVRNRTSIVPGDNNSVGEPVVRPRVTVEHQLVRPVSYGAHEHVVPVEVVTTSTTVVEYTTIPPLSYQQQQHYRSQDTSADTSFGSTTFSPVRPTDNSLQNNGKTANSSFLNNNQCTSSSSGFFSSSSFSNPAAAHSPSSLFSPTADDLTASTLQSASDQPPNTCRIPTSRSCPFPDAIAESPASHHRLKKGISSSTGKKQPPLVRFNQLGDISPTIKKQQKHIAAADNTPLVTSSSPCKEQEELSPARRLFSRSFIRGSGKRQSLFTRNNPSNSKKVPTSTTMPSLRGASPCPNDVDEPDENGPRRSNSLSSIILAFLKGRPLRSSRPTSPRVASPVGPRLSPRASEHQPGYHCDVPSCHCHIYPEAYSRKTRRSTSMHRPHLQHRHQYTVNSDTLQSGYSSSPQTPLGRKTNSPPTFLRGYGPNAPDDPAPEFHRRLSRVALSRQENDSFDNEDVVVTTFTKKHHSRRSERSPVALTLPVKTSTPYSNASSFSAEKFNTLELNGDANLYYPIPSPRSNGVTLGRHKKAKANKPPPIVSFIENGSEEDLLYRDGDLIQSVNGNHAAPQVDGEVTKPSGKSKRALLFPRSPESPPAQRMPVVFLPAYAPHCNGSASSSVSSINNHHYYNGNAKINQTKSSPSKKHSHKTQNKYKPQQTMTPLRA